MENNVENSVNNSFHPYPWEITIISYHMTHVNQWLSQITLQPKYNGV